MQFVVQLPSELERQEWQVIASWQENLLDMLMQVELGVSPYIDLSIKCNKTQAKIRVYPDKLEGFSPDGLRDHVCHLTQAQAWFLDELNNETANRILVNVILNVGDVPPDMSAGFVTPWTEEIPFNSLTA